MTDQAQEDAQQGDEDQNMVRMTRADIQALENSSTEGKKARQELAFVKAGIDTDKGTGKLAFDAYNGEPTVEAVQEFARQYNLLASEDDSDEGEENQSRYGEDEARSTQARRAAATGSDTGADAEEHPSDKAARVGHEIRKDYTMEDSLAAAIATKADAAVRGDKRAIVRDPDRPAPSFR